MTDSLAHEHILKKFHLLVDHVEWQGWHALKVFWLAHHIIKSDGRVSSKESLEAWPSRGCDARQMTNLNGFDITYLMFKGQLE